MAKAPPKRTSVLYDPIKTMARMTDEVIVGVSGGKDSAVTLDLCCKYFKHVVGYFMYYIPGLSFQQRILNYYRKKYGIEIIELPHFELSIFYKYGTYRPPDLSVPIVGIAEMYDYIREQTGVYWIAWGERIADSIVRRAMIKKSGSIDKVRGRFYPVAYWNKADIMDYIRLHRVKVGEESAVLGFSFGSLQNRELSPIKEHYPADFERIKHFFPWVEAGLKREDYFGKMEVNDNGKDENERDEGDKDKTAQTEEP